MEIKSFSRRQLEVLTWWTDRSGWAEAYEAVICDGAVRAGKTLCMGLSFVCWAMRRFAGQQFALCGKSIGSLQRNVLAELLPALGEIGFSCREQREKNRFTVEFLGRRNSFYLFGGGDEGCAARIQGLTLAGVLFDEAALLARSFVEQACARCSVAGSRFWFNCNPESPEHWFYKEWIQKRTERRALYLHFTMADNPSLSKETLARYARMYTGSFYRRFILGEWAAAQGQIYDFFDEGYVQAVPEGELERYCISCDYGTRNPASFGLWGLRAGVWYRVQEYYYDARQAMRQKTDEEYVRDLLALAGGRRLEAVVVDPSAASFIQALQRAALPVRRADNDVLTGIRVTAGLLRAGKIVICRPCVDAIREFSLYRWDEDAGGVDRPVKADDHAMDDIRYFAMTIAKGREAVLEGRWVER